jgi:hypothetical protein
MPTIRERISTLSALTAPVTIREALDSARRQYGQVINGSIISLITAEAEVEDRVADPFISAATVENSISASATVQTSITASAIVEEC